MILCAGEALIDMLPRATGEGEAFLPIPGGAVFNTAIALGRLGHGTNFLCGLSTDFFGAKLADTLEASKVDIAMCPRSGRPTTLAFVHLTDGQAQYVFYDEGTALREMTEADLPEVPDNCEALFFGCISLTSDPCASAYEALLHGNRRGRTVMIDPNIRAGFIKDEESYRARLARMIAASDIVKLSDEDLHWLGGPGDAVDLSRALIATGPALVCITKGAEGVTGITADAVIEVPATKAEVVDTVGAGDTFNAGLLSVLSERGALGATGARNLPEDTIREAIAFGARVAAVTVSRAGANPPWREELTA